VNPRLSKNPRMRDCPLSLGFHSPFVRTFSLKINGQLPMYELIRPLSDHSIKPRHRRRGRELIADV